LVRLNNLIRLLNTADALEYVTLTLAVSAVLYAGKATWELLVTVSPLKR
jgi:hypothetical protein